MKLITWTRMLLAVCVTLPAAVQGQFIPTIGLDQPDTALVSASGLGEVVVAPQRAVLFVQLVTEDSASEAAASANGALRSNVVERLVELGIGPDLVSLWGYGAAPATNRGRVAPPGPGGIEASFEAKSGIRVVVEPVGRLDEVVSALLASGASAIPLVQFEGGETEEARREAARIAVQNARVAAESIADAAGGRLGDLVNLTVIPDYTSIVATSRFLQSGFLNQGVQLYPSDVSLKVQVQASWVFERR